MQHSSELGVDAIIPLQSDRSIAAGSFLRGCGVPMTETAAMEGESNDVETSLVSRLIDIIDMIGVQDELETDGGLGIAWNIVPDVHGRGNALNRQAIDDKAMVSKRKKERNERERKQREQREETKERDQKLSRWSAIVAESCKQSGNPFLPLICSPVSIQYLFGNHDPRRMAPAKTTNRNVLFLLCCTESEAALSGSFSSSFSSLSSLSSTSRDDVLPLTAVMAPLLQQASRIWERDMVDCIVLLVGSEGGFSPDELSFVLSRDTCDVRR